MAFIYALLHPVTDEMRYIGQTRKPLAYRLCVHVALARRGDTTHSARWIKTLLDCELKPKIVAIEETNEPDEREIYWIAYYRAAGYRLTNIMPGGSGPGVGPCPEETRRKLSAALKGRPKSPAHAAKVGAAHKGRVKGPMPQEIREKIQQTSKGRCPKSFATLHTPENWAKAAAARIGSKRGPHTAEAKAKMSASKKGQKTSRVYGPMSDETKAKLRAANLGKKNGPPSEETRAKIAAANTGKRHPPEVLAKIAAKNRGRKWTDEQKANLRAIRQQKAQPITS